MLAWLMAQVAELLLEAFGAPAWVMKTLLTLFLIGFPFAVIFSWAFELTPDGVKRESEVDRSASITAQTGRKLDRTIIVLLVLIAAYFIWEARFSGQRSTSSEPVVSEPSVETDMPAADRRSIAVLPFDNRSRQVDDEFFVEGIHDDLLTNLAQIGSLKVISRTSVNQYKETGKTIPEIARELGVAAVMEGAVQRSGGTVRINVQLIDAESDEHLWAEIYDRALTADNLFAIQSEISEAIARELQAVLTPEDKNRLNSRPTESLEAYTAYLRGLQLIERRNSADVEAAMAHFREAVELDPDFALGWTGIAYAANMKTSYGSQLVRDAHATMEPALQRALELDPNLAEAHLMMAPIYNYRQQYDKQEQSYLRAIELNPNLSLAYQWYSGFLRDRPARYQEAYELIEKAVDLNPLSSLTRLNMVWVLNNLGRFEEAEEKLVQILERDPEFVPAYGSMASTQLNKGRIDLYVHWNRKAAALDPGDVDWYLNQVLGLFMLGDIEGVEALKETLQTRFPGHPTPAVIDLWMNIYNKNIPGALEAARWFDQAVGSHPSFQNVFATLHMFAGDFDAARAAYEVGSPDHFDRQKWASVIEDLDDQTCLVALVMMRTGDEQMGQDLLDATIRYMENELPRYTEHADRFDYPACYAINGQYDESLEAFHVHVDHGHFKLVWWIDRELISWVKPMIERVERPEWTARIEKMISEQYENLKRLEAEGY